MGGFFGVVSKEDCVVDLFYGTDYHSHLGTRRGGMAVWDSEGIARFIHDITASQFRSKFEHDVTRLRGKAGIGVISDYEDQPLIIGSHLGTYALVTVGCVKNLDELTKRAFQKRVTHFSEMSGNAVNPTELVATLINEGATFEEGLRIAQDTIVGSCSVLVLTARGIYAARDRLGRTPIILGRKEGAVAATFETTAFPNLGYEVEHVLGPGEVVFFDAEGWETRVPPRAHMQICAFLWIYYGYPSSVYEGIAVEDVRNRCGACLARRDKEEGLTVDEVAGIPDSGVGHALGYAHEAGVPYRRPFVKYTPTWPRSFMPQDQRMRDLVARMKLIPIRSLIQGKRLLFCEDSIVRGTQLRETIRRLYAYGAREIHMRAACPPLLFACKFLNFSRSKSELDLAGRRAIHELEGPDANVAEYVKSDTPKHQAMVEWVRRHLDLTTLRYQKLTDMLAAIGLSPDHVCTYCWTGEEKYK